MKLQKKIIQTDFAHFPRPGENDPYVGKLILIGTMIDEDAGSAKLGIYIQSRGLLSIFAI